MRAQDFTKPLVDINGNSDIDVNLELFEQFHYKQAGVLLENNNINSADIEYIKNLSHYSDEPKVGSKFIPVCLALLSVGLKVYGNTNTTPVKLVDVKNENGMTIYKFSDGSKLPDSRLHNSSYYQTFLFSNNVNYDKFRSAISIKFSLSLPSGKFDSNLQESISKEEIKNFVEMFSKFLPLAMHYLELDHLPKMHFTSHIKDTQQPTFGMYVNGKHTLHVALADRHPNDILRTVAHELTHYKQDSEHQLNDQSGNTGSPEENQANQMAGIIMRHFNKRYPQYLSSSPIT